jgi:hypothetical protein
MIAGGEAAPQEGAKQQRLMALYESRLTDSLGPINAKTLARDIARDKPLDIPAWLEARNVTLLGDKAVSVLNDLYAEAGWVGVCLARAELDYARTLGKADNPELSVDWSGWVPGDPDAARLLLSEAGTGLKGLLDRAAITIKGVNDSRVSELGNLLARTVGEGASMRTTAAAIREQFGTGNKWSKTVAQTETRRAVTAASVDTYQGAGVGSVEWLTAWGEACPICKEFEDMGPVLIGSGAFDGDDGPPGHPNCFCVILPVIDPEMLRPVDETLDIEEIGGEARTGRVAFEEFASAQEQELDRLSAEAKSDALAAISEWRGGGYVDMNRYLYEGAEISDELRQSVDDLIKAADEIGVVRDEYLVRRYTLADRVQDLLAMEPGDIYEPRGFMATTMAESNELAQNVAIFAKYSDVEIEIALTPGSRALSTHFGSAINEAEVLVPPGSRLRVVSIVDNKVRLEAIPMKSVKGITKAGRNEVDSALKALDEIPDVEPGEIAVPWVMTNAPKLEDEEWRESVVKNVPIGTLLASQPRLTRERVEYFILNTGSVEEGRRAFPNVYHRGNEWVIVDGHHRLAALWLLGADHANVWLLEGSE